MKLLRLLSGILGILGLVLSVPTAHGLSVADADANAQAIAQANGFEATFGFAFQLESSGIVYAKLLPTASNPIHDGVGPNGSVALDRSTGLVGWWITFDVDAAEQPQYPQYLGAYVDGTPTAAVELDAGVHHLGVHLHAPRDAFVGRNAYDVPIVLASKAVVDAASSGAAVDTSRALSAHIERPDSEPVPAPPETTIRSPTSWLVLAGIAMVAVVFAVVVARRLRARA